MINRNIQMKKREGNQWDNLYPITLSKNVFNQNGVDIDNVLSNYQQTVNNQFDLKADKSDVNNRFNLVNQNVNRHESEISSLERNKIDMGRVRVNDIDKSYGKLDATYMSEDFLNQFVNNTLPVNAVIDDYSLTANKYANNSVDYLATSFLELDRSKNLFGGNWGSGNLLGAGVPWTFTTSPTKNLAIIPVKPNKRYLIVFEHGEIELKKIAATTHLLKDGELTTDVGRIMSSTQTAQYLTTDNNSRYLYIAVGNKQDGSIPFLRVEQRDPDDSTLNQIEPNEEYPVVPKNISVYSKSEVDSLIRSNGGVLSNWLWLGDSLSANSQLPERTINRIGGSVVDGSFAGGQLTENINQVYNDMSVLAISDQIKNKDFTRLQNAITTQQNEGMDVSRKIENMNYLKAMNFSNIEKVIIFAGTNDFNGAKDTLNVFKTKVEQIIVNLITANPKIQIFFITPLYRHNGHVPNSRGHILDDYATAIEEVANSKGLPCLNLLKNGNVNELNHETFLRDGLHQNDIGDVMLSEKIANFLTSH